MHTDKKNHWEKVYLTKTPEQVSWTQAVPKTSLRFIHTFQLDKSAKIIDIGGGDSKLVDYLLDEGFRNITVLDISATSLERAKLRLGSRAKKVNWIVSDILAFEPQEEYDVWHDRAAFHFLTTKEEIIKYAEIAKKAVKGYMSIGTFSEKGPTKCSGLSITQYNANDLTTVFKNGFVKTECFTEEHTTPFETKQHFLFCGFKRHK
ncbi:trans-aconitate 2-methyltransferase [Flavobacterium sp.]|uniref:class I SAM-dependent methyltransferase n=1 Tax=Flavobacterium sp. TaxID=239 RepID=UPI0035297B66